MHKSGRGHLLPHGRLSIFVLQAALAQAVVVVQMSIIATLMFGDKIFPMLGMQPPAVYHQVQDKKFQWVSAA